MAQRLLGWVFAAVTLAATLGPSAAAHAESRAVYCRYVAYGTEYQMCSAGPVAEAKQACEEAAQKKVGDKIECWCTDDPEYVGGFCKEHAPAK